MSLRLGRRPYLDEELFQGVGGLAVFVAGPWVNTSSALTA